MRDITTMTQNQLAGVDRLYEHDHTLLVGNMGSGKTVVALTAIKELFDDCVLSRVLVVAPKTVAETVWRQEAEQWAHLSGLRIVVCTGPEKHRRAALADIDPGDTDVILVTNYENLSWLFKRQPEIARSCDGLVIDESTKLTHVGGLWVKTLRPRLKQFRWRVSMTGTPVTENWQALYGQMLLVDGGAALGRNKEKFLRTFFYPTDFQNRNWEMFPDSADQLLRLIRPHLFVLADYRAELPSVSVFPVEVDMPVVVQNAHERMRLELSVEVGPDGEILAAPSAGVAVGKLQQISCGFVYAPDRAEPSHVLSNFRVEVAIERLRARLDQNDSVVLLYWFKADYDRLRSALARKLPQARVAAFTDSTDHGHRGNVCQRWNEGKLDVVLLHPRSAGHGIQLQHGGRCMLWFCPVWSRDLWEQTIARVWRRGQKRPVEVEVIVASRSIDVGIMQRLGTKAENMLRFESLL